jgi:hypothetical protein
MVLADRANPGVIGTPSEKLLAVHRAVALDSADKKRDGIGRPFHVTEFQLDYRPFLSMNLIKSPTRQL